jgi:hypothetical protein
MVVQDRRMSVPLAATEVGKSRNLRQAHAATCTSPVVADLRPTQAVALLDTIPSVSQRIAEIIVAEVAHLSPVRERFHDFFHGFPMHFRTKRRVYSCHSTEHHFLSSGLWCPDLGSQTRDT